MRAPSVANPATNRTGNASSSALGLRMSSRDVLDQCAAGVQAREHPQRSRDREHLPGHPREPPSERVDLEGPEEGDAGNHPEDEQAGGAGGRRRGERRRPGRGGRWRRRPERGGQHPPGSQSHRCAQRDRDRGLERRLRREPQRSPPAGVQECRLGATPGDRERRRRGHHCRRHSQSRDQQKPKRTLDRRRPAFHLAHHERHRRTELGVTPPEEEGAPERPAATLEEPSDPRLTVGHLVRELAGVSVDLASFVQRERESPHGGHPPEIDVAPTHAPREIGELLTTQEDELRGRGTVEALGEDLLFPRQPVVAPGLRIQTAVDAPHLQVQGPAFSGDLDHVPGSHAELVRDQVGQHRAAVFASADHFDVAGRVRSREQPPGDRTGLRRDPSGKRHLHHRSECVADGGREVGSFSRETRELLVQPIREQRVAVIVDLLVESDVGDAVEHSGPVRGDRGVRDLGLEQLAFGPREEQRVGGRDQGQQERADHDGRQEPGIADRAPTAPSSRAGCRRPRRPFACCPLSATLLPVDP